MKLNKLFLFISLLLISPIIVNADCDSEIKEYQKIKKEIKITSEIDEATKESIIIVKNPYMEQFIAFPNDEEGQIKCESNEENILRCNNAKAGKTEIFVISRKDYQCVVDNFTYNNPKYNNFYKDKLCEGNEEFYLCQETIDEDIDYDTFISRINSYKKSKQKVKPSEEEKKEESNKILKYYEENKITVITATIFIILLVISVILIFKSERDKRVLK